MKTQAKLDQSLDRFKNNPTFENRQEFLNMLQEKCSALRTVKKYNEETQLVEGLIEFFENNENPDINSFKIILFLYFTQLDFFSIRKMYDDAIMICKKVNKKIETYKDKDSEIMIISADAYYRENQIFLRCDQYQEAIQALDELSNKFKNEENILIQKRVIEGLYDKGDILSHYLNEDLKAIEAFDEVNNRFKDKKEFDFRLLVASSLYYKTIIVSKKLKTDSKNKSFFTELIKIYDEIDQRYKNDKETNIRNIVATILRNKIHYCLIFDETAIAHEIIKTIKKRYKANESPEIQHVLNTLPNNFQILY